MSLAAQEEERVTVKLRIVCIRDADPESESTFGPFYEIHLDGEEGSPAFTTSDPAEIGPYIAEFMGAMQSDEPSPGLLQDIATMKMGRDGRAHAPVGPVSWARTPKALAEGSMRRFRCTFIGRRPGRQFRGLVTEIIEAMSADEARRICLSTFDVQGGLRVTELDSGDPGHIEGITAAKTASRILLGQDGPFEPDPPPTRGPTDCPWCGYAPEMAPGGATLQRVKMEDGSLSEPVCVDCRRHYRDWLHDQARQEEDARYDSESASGHLDGPFPQSMENYTTYGKG